MLLKVWEVYYINKTKDIYGLQFSTNINFYAFKQIKKKIDIFTVPKKNLINFSLSRAQK
jgi:hypothetical protein